MLRDSVRWLPTLLCILAVSLSSTCVAQPQCSDGVDNDGDGGTDYLVEIQPNNGETFSVGGGGDPFAVMNAVANEVRNKRLPRSIPTSPLLRTIAGSGNHFRWRDGIFEVTTLNEVCRIFGYATYVSSTCLDSERSHRYPAGKCNFHSPHDDRLTSFNGYDFVPGPAKEKYTKTWLASIQCKDRLAACSDGVDNDGDGAVDYPADSGCASKNDDSERPHDVDCTSRDDPSEFPQCSDRIDNDHDGLIDMKDPGCSNPQDNNESDDPTATPTPTATCTSTHTPKPTKTPTPTSTPTCSTTPTPKPTRTPTPTCTSTPKPKATHTPTPKPTKTPTPAPVTVRPVMDCVEPMGGGTFRAFFGYRNDSLQDVEIPVGPSNALAPRPADRGQPTRFRSGGVANAFSAQFSGALTWFLQGQQVTADTSSPRCEGCRGANCADTCSKRDGRSELVKVTSSCNEHYKITIKLVRAYANALRDTPMRDERRMVRSLRAEAEQWYQVQSEALAELARHDWYTCGNSSCERVDFSPYTQALDRSVRELTGVQRLIMGAWHASGVSLDAQASALATEGQAREASVIRQLGKLPAYVSKCN